MSSVFKGDQAITVDNMVTTVTIKTGSDSEKCIHGYGF